ncbi:MAG: hypothetical protein LUC96_01200 [Alistipes sp.]|uniref:hypothetical protein n=1 Tax=Alistipes sp. TaxID=1872444 RepID=UPI0025BB329C|nr:hypothetical protein [Alistipes sp.]MCD8273597.1 hypothetical protein [Alistipes sp.]
MKQQFDSELRLSKANRIMLERINTILEEYRNDGYVLTLRQLYYQLVSKDIIPNNDREYAKLSNILKKGRMAGIVDWSAIEDRVRVPKLPYWVRDVQHAIQDTIEQYRVDRMQGQQRNIEIWVEKDALSNVLFRVTSKYHIRLMVNRGYSSISAMYDAHRRLLSGDVILYFGDHDPSGKDMVRDIRERMEEFGREVDVRPVALTMEQIRRFNPPPNPAKITDLRAKWYIREYGRTSWELDALPPRELIRLAEEAVEELIDLDLYNRCLDREQRDIEELRSFFNV